MIGHRSWGARGVGLKFRLAELHWLLLLVTLLTPLAAPAGVSPPRPPDEPRQELPTEEFSASQPSRAVPLQSRAWFLPGVLAGVALLASSVFIAVQARAELAHDTRTVDEKVVERTSALEEALAVQQRMEASLREREGEAREKLASLVEHSSDLIATADLDGRITYLNPAGRRLLGTPATQAVESLTFQEMLPESVRSFFLEKVVPAARDHGLWEGELQLRHCGDDAPIDVSLSTFLIRHPTTGDPLSYGTVTRDITRQRQLEARGRQAQKLESLGTLAGGIAHDFNNILGAIFGNVHLARLDLPASHPATISLAEIELAARRAKALVQQILAFGCPQPHARRAVDLAPIIEEATRLLRPSLPSGVELALAIEQDAPKILADPAQMHLVLLNLCTNSWHALKHDRGRIEIRLRPVDVPPPSGSDSNSSLPPGRHACLSVTDDGDGMDAATADRVFEPFFTTKQPGRGTGLGLSVVHGIVKGHNGTIQIQSESGRGTTIEICLPAVADESDAPALTPARPLHPGQGQRILYLDDESALVDIAVRMLRRLNYDVAGFTRPEAALASFRSNPDEYALIITDLHMPGQSGFEFAQTARSIRPGIPTVLSSGHLTDDVARQAAKLGINHLLHKPTELEDFSDMIHQLLTPSVSQP